MTAAARITDITTVAMSTRIPPRPGEGRSGAVPPAVSAARRSTVDRPPTRSRARVWRVTSSGADGHRPVSGHGP
ncbi:MAG: hypothetical protein L0H64_07190, partial [Pseudonocardia sp.]|nr:hypothetical protein [Pseudonocardia sp.]